jgi:type III restriction enzyme
LLFRRSGDRFVIDVVEPHRTDLDDTFAKAKGLAQYAEAYGTEFGKLMMLRIEGLGDKRLFFGFDVNDTATRRTVLRLRSNEEVQGLYRPLD